MYTKLKDFDLQIENPIDKDVLKLLLENLQYRYDNPKHRDHAWNIDENGFRLTLERKTNCNENMLQSSSGKLRINLHK